MRKFLVLCLVLMTFLTTIPVQAIEVNKETLKLTAESAVLIDANSGTVLYQKEAFEKKYPASITKIMTVFLALEKGNPNQMLTVKDTAIDTIDRSSTHIWLTYDEEAPLIDLCYAAMLQSANDASNVIAEGIGGTIENFVSLMNDEAIKAGALGTNFANAHGLPDENHYTTAYDMAMITRYALANDQFKEVFEAYNYTMNPTNKQKDSRIFATGNEFIKKGAHKYEYAKGGKVGWTEDAGYTMVATAEKDGLDLIAVVLNSDSKDNRFHDVRALLDYGFKNYKNATIKADGLEPKTYQVMDGKKVEADCTFTVEHDFTILLDADEIEELITVEYEVRNEESPETVECYAVLKKSGMSMGEQLMKKEVIVHDLSFKATVLPKIFNVIDYFCVGIFVIMMGLCFTSYVTQLIKKK